MKKWGSPFKYGLGAEVSYRCEVGCLHTGVVQERWWNGMVYDNVYRIQFPDKMVMRKEEELEDGSMEERR